VSVQIDTAKIERILDRPLTEEEAYETELFNKGRLLQHLVAQPGWPVVLEMLQKYVKGALEELANISPADEAKVKAQHAVVFALSALYNRFIQDVDIAIDASRRPPETITQALKKPTPAPLVELM